MKILIQNIMLNKEDDQTFYKKIPFDLDIKKHEELYEDKNELKP